MRAAVAVFGDVRLEMSLPEALPRHEHGNPRREADYIAVEVRKKGSSSDGTPPSCRSDARGDPLIVR
jgi:hypothetical protein